MTASERAFPIGIFLPHFELPWNGQTPRWSEMLAFAQKADEIGFDTLWLPDHYLFQFDGVHTQGAWDVWSLMAALAAVTKRIEIAPLVACSSFRNPALIAKMAETIDEISGGRFSLGLGAGWHRPEYDAMGLPYDYRVSRFEEALQIITSLVRTGKVDFEGRFYSAKECELRPRGPRPAGMPIVLGGAGERLMRLAATYADAWNVDRRNDPVVVRALNDKLDSVCRDVGRDPKTLERVIGVQVDVLNEHRSAFLPRQFVAHTFPWVGEPAKIAERLLAYREAGADRMLVWVDPVTPAGLEAFAPVLAEVAARA